MGVALLARFALSLSIAIGHAAGINGWTPRYGFLCFRVTVCQVMDNALWWLLYM